VIVVSHRSMTAIMAAYHALKECGRDDEADELLASFREPVQASPVPAPEPPKRPKTKTPEQLEAAAARAKRYRERNGATPRVTSRHGVTNGVTERDVQRDEFSSRSRASKEEEKRKPLLSGQFSAESESSESSCSSELDASERDASRVTSVTNGVTNERDAKLKLLIATPAAAAPSKLSSQDVAREWNAAYQHRNPGGSGHTHRVRAHRENFEHIAVVLNGFKSPHQVLTALCEWVWLAPGGVHSRVPFLKPETVVASLDRDLKSAHEWWISEARAQSAKGRAVG